MSTAKETKINHLLKLIPSNAVLLASWLADNGYSHELQRRYRSSGWFESIGSGAMKRSGEKISYEGALYALQTQINSEIHPGGRTALSILGKAHYLELNTQNAVLFGSEDEVLPAWFKKYNWGIRIDYHATSFLPANLGLEMVEMKSFSLKISGAARAMMECLYLTPHKQEISECYELMEGLNNLPPKKIQQLLEACNSIKVKRLFLYMAEKAGHEWFKHLNLKKINLGEGKRSLTTGKKGIYIDKYKIVVPQT
ncbi:MAG: hypothetical protein EPN39_04340 [Chitinophagaceae bacterium]|nr:MAG: hypothetical protein EPN39_04340 [Chitinophagaceae bacterium]